jgi:hypothetical protein
MEDFLRALIGQRETTFLFQVWTTKILSERILILLGKMANLLVIKISLKVAKLRVIIQFLDILTRSFASRF